MSADFSIIANRGYVLVERVDAAAGL